MFLPGESQGQGSLVGCHLWGRTESDTTEATQQQQQDKEGWRYRGDKNFFLKGLKRFNHCGNCCTACECIKNPGYIPKKMNSGSQGDICIPMFIAALFSIIHTSQNMETNQMPCNRWMCKGKYICLYKMKHYSAMRKEETLFFMVAWMDLENIMLIK